MTVDDGDAATLEIREAIEEALGGDLLPFEVAEVDIAARGGVQSRHWHNALRAYGAVRRTPGDAFGYIRFIALRRAAEDMAQERWGCVEKWPKIDSIEGEPA